MTNTVIHMTHSVDRESIGKLFDKFTNKYGKLWSGRLGENGDWSDCENDWYEELSQFTLGEVLGAVKKSFSLYPEFPPTQPQLIALCLKESGLPDAQETINLMITRDFSHPVVKMMYDKIGSWTLANGKENEINFKAKEAYPHCVAEFQESPRIYWDKLKSYNDKPKELPALPKIPRVQERRSLKERLEEYRQLANDQKEKLKGTHQKEFDQSKLNPKRKEFDIKLFNEYKYYLLGISDDLILSLSVLDCYNRAMFLSQREQPEYLRKTGYVPNSQRPQKEPQKASGKNYKNWMND